jgi:hypothetical protein
MDNITPQQRKTMWIAGGVVAFWYVGRPMLFYIIQLLLFPFQAFHQAQRPQQPPATPATLGIPMNRLTGIWEGKGPIEGRGNCGLRFEMRQAQQAGHFSGFFTLTCQLRSAAPPIPATAILSGAAEKGSFQFHVDKVVGPDASGCAPSAFTLTPFGSSQLAAEWQETTCGGGHLMLQRTKP